METNEFNNELCEICDLNKGVGIIRSKLACKKCFSILSKDNARLFANDEDIPNDISYLKRCGLYTCTNKFISKIKYDGNDIMKEYCSDICKKKDIEIQERNKEKPVKE